MAPTPAAPGPQRQDPRPPATRSSGPQAFKYSVEDGIVGILEFEPGEGTTRKSTTISANPDETLGGNMPGLVLPVDGEAARSLNLTATRTELVALLDFGSLEGRQQARVRGAISRLAPGAQVADGTTETHYAQERSLAAVTGATGGVLTLLIMALGGMALASGERLMRRTLVDIGAARGRRARLFVSVALVPAVSIILVGLASVATAGVAGVKLPGSYGLWWLAPPIGGLIGCVIVFIALYRVPERLSE